MQRSASRASRPRTAARSGSTLTNASAPTKDWSYYEHGVARQTSFGTQTITMTPGSVEEFDTIVAHHGVKTWQWHLGVAEPQPVLEA